MPCGGTCDACPAANLCEAGADFDPAEMEAFLNGELTDDGPQILTDEAAREVAAWLRMPGHEGQLVLGTPGSWARRGWAT